MDEKKNEDISESSSEESTQKAGPDSIQTGTEETAPQDNASGRPPRFGNVTYQRKPSTRESADMVDDSQAGMEASDSVDGPQAEQEAGGNTPPAIGKHTQPEEIDGVRTEAVVAGTNGDSTETIVAGINEIADGYVEKGMMAIGEYVLQEVFDGDAESALSRNPRKLNSMRRICQHQALRVSPRSLTQSVGAAALKKELEVHKVRTPDLKTSHYVALLPLKDSKTRCELAREAQEKGLSVRELAEMVKQKVGKKVVLDVGKQIVKSIVQPARVIDDDNLIGICSDRQCLERELSGADRRRILDEIQKGKPRLEKWNELMQELENHLSDIEGTA